MKITLSPIEHRGTTQIKISFDYDLKVKEYVKRFPGVMWSQTHKGFYIPFSKSTTNSLYLYLRKQGYFVDYSALKTLKTTPGPRKNEETLTETNKKRLEQYCDYLKGLRLSQSTMDTYSTFISLLLLYLKVHPFSSN